MKKINNIDDLIEKYFDGETSVAEEKILHVFFKQKNLPDTYRAEKAMFDHFVREKAARMSKQVVFTPKVLRWAAVAAMVSGTVWVINQQINHLPSLMGSRSYAIIDGQLYTDAKTVKEHAMKALADVTNGTSKKASSNEAEQLMKEQLCLFE